jgi:hypothetical protein
VPSAKFSFTSVDPTLPRRLLGVEPAPATAREIHHAGVVTYLGRAETDAAARHRHTFTVEFGTENAAGILANWLWNALHGHVASLEVGGDVVPLQNAAIKRALLARASVD